MDVFVVFAESILTSEVCSCLVLERFRSSNLGGSSIWLMRREGLLEGFEWSSCAGFPVSGRGCF